GSFEINKFSEKGNIVWAHQASKWLSGSLSPILPSDDEDDSIISPVVSPIKDKRPAPTPARKRARSPSPDNDFEKFVDGSIDGPTDPPSSPLPDGYMDVENTGLEFDGLDFDVDNVSSDFEMQDDSVAAELTDPGTIKLGPGIADPTIQLPASTAVTHNTTKVTAETTDPGAIDLGPAISDLTIQVPASTIITHITAKVNGAPASVDTLNAAKTHGVDATDPDTQLAEPITDTARAGGNGALPPSDGRATHNIITDSSSDNISTDPSSDSNNSNTAIMNRSGKINILDDEVNLPRGKGKAKRKGVSKVARPDQAPHRTSTRERKIPPKSTPLLASKSAAPPRRVRASERWSIVEVEEEIGNEENLLPI
ncbi:hypothetical protein FA15DRAFT_710827, partial [Coprinopsis marcescibilis]